MLASIAGTDRIMVNSLHHQGVRKLGPALIEEARADDGAHRSLPRGGARGASRWRCSGTRNGSRRENRFSTALFKAFGDAARERAAQDLHR